MSGLDQLAISRVLGSTFQPFGRRGFGGFSAVATVGNMLAIRPRTRSPLPADPSRDATIVQGFKKHHRGFAIDRFLADPDLVEAFLDDVRKNGVDAAAAQINRRLLRIRKAGQLKVPTTAEDRRDLTPFLIPAELAVAQLGYRFDATYDDLLADPEIGNAFDELALKLGGTGTRVDYRLAALHLRKNIRSRKGKEAEELLNFGVTDLNDRWKAIGPISHLDQAQVPTTEGIFAISEPNRFLYLTRFANIKAGLDRFRNPALLSGIGNHFWKPSVESLSVQLIRREEAKGCSFRLLELKALEIYRPIFNLLPKEQAA